MKLRAYIVALHAALFAILLAVSPAGSGSMSLMGVGKPAGGGGATLTYTVTDVSKAWQAGTSFTTVNIGTVAADRIIVVSLLNDSNNTVNGRPSSVTVGG